MAVLRIGDYEYRTEKLDLREQLHVARKLHPLVGALRDAFLRGSTFILKFLPKQEGEEATKEKLSLEDFISEIDAIEPFTTALGKMDEKDADYIMNVCLSKVYRGYRNQATGEIVSWNVVADSLTGRVMFEDISLSDAIQLVWTVAKESLASFSFESLLSASSG
jgi:hypothetical protein